MTHHLQIAFARVVVKIYLFF